MPENISLLLAFFAGVLSFISPCVLPLVPAYVSYLAGSTAAAKSTAATRINTVLKASGFVLGFSSIFIIMGASASWIGQLFSQHMGVFRKVGGVLIVIFGLHTIGLFKLKLFYREKKLFHPSFDRGGINSIFLGMAFAAGWTPCVGPILSSILVYAGSLETMSQGIWLLVIYSAGLAVPFLLMAAAVDLLSKYTRALARHFDTISLISGSVLILMGVLIYTNKVSILSRYLNFINI